jgi:hypothetical protein
LSLLGQFAEHAAPNNPSSLVSLVLHRTLFDAKSFDRNWGLHVTSSAHRISVYSMNKSRDLTRKRLDKFEQLGAASPLAPLTWPEEFPTQSWDEYKKFWKENDPRDVDD